MSIQLVRKGKHRLVGRKKTEDREREVRYLLLTYSNGSLLRGEGGTRLGRLNLGQIEILRV